MSTTEPDGSDQREQQITDLFLGQDLPLLAALLRNRLTTAQRNELAALITAA